MRPITEQPCAALDYHFQNLGLPRARAVVRLTKMKTEFLWLLVQRWWEIGDSVPTIEVRTAYKQCAHELAILLDPQDALVPAPSSMSVPARSRSQGHPG
jgi:hypothetical protein